MDKTTSKTLQNYKIPSRSSVSLITSGLNEYYKDVLSIIKTDKTVINKYFFDVKLSKEDFDQLLKDFFGEKISVENIVGSFIEPWIKYYNQLDSGTPSDPEVYPTVPTNIDEMVERLDNLQKQKKSLSRAQISQKRKEMLNEVHNRHGQNLQNNQEETKTIVQNKEGVSSPPVEKVSTTPPPSPPSSLGSAATASVAPTIIPTTFKSDDIDTSKRSSMETPSSKVATRILKNKMTALGHSRKDINKLIRNIEIEKEKSPRASRRSVTTTAGLKSGLTQDQVGKILDPTKGEMAIAPKNSFRDFFSRARESLFGKRQGESAAGRVSKRKTSTRNIILFKKISSFFSGKMGKGGVAGGLLATSGLFGISLAMAPVSAPLSLFSGVASGSTGLATLANKSGGWSKMISSTLTAVSGLFSALVTTSTLGVATVAVTATFITLVSIALIMFIINSGAYITPSPANLLSGEITSPYIDVKKMASPSGPFENSDLPLTITYTITVAAKKGVLTNVNFNNSCKVSREKSSPPCSPPVPQDLPPDFSIHPSTPFEFVYDQTYDSPDFTDSFVTDIFTVTADSPDQKGAVAAASEFIKIGKPPEECPSEKPVDGGPISQGAYSPKGWSHNSQEAIDIAVGPSTVYSGHSGVVVTSEKNSCLGNYIEIKSTCEGKEFKSRYAHLKGRKVRVGDFVTQGSVIGLSGDTGSRECTTGAHLHYQFLYTSGGAPSFPNRPPYMTVPYIPTNIPRGCTNEVTCGSI